MLQKVGDRSSNSRKNQAAGNRKKGKVGYFDKDSLVQEIIALLTMDSRLRAGEIDRRCPSSPEQQAISDTLRWMRKQGMVRMDAKKTWSLCDGVRCSAEARDAVILAEEKPLNRMQMEPLKKRIIEVLRTAFEQTNKKYMTHSELVFEFVDGLEITKHAVSQALQQLVKEHKVVKYLGGIHDYMYHKPYFDQHPSLFDNHPSFSGNAFSSGESNEPSFERTGASINIDNRATIVKMSMDSVRKHDDNVIDNYGDQMNGNLEYSLVMDADDGYDGETESDRRRRKMRIRRRVLVAQTRIQVRVRRRHKVDED